MIRYSTKMTAQGERKIDPPFFSRREREGIPQFLSTTYDSPAVVKGVKLPASYLQEARVHGQQVIATLCPFIRNTKKNYGSRYRPSQASSSCTFRSWVAWVFMWCGMPWKSRNLRGAWLPSLYAR